MYILLLRPSTFYHSNQRAVSHCVKVPSHSNFSAAASYQGMWNRIGTEVKETSTLLLCHLHLILKHRLTVYYGTGDIHTHYSFATASCIELLWFLCWLRFSECFSLQSNPNTQILFSSVQIRVLCMTYLRIKVLLELIYYRPPKRAKINRWMSLWLGLQPVASWWDGGLAPTAY